MRKQYETPKLEIILSSEDDLVVTSLQDGGTGTGSSGSFGDMFGTP